MSAQTTRPASRRKPSTVRDMVLSLAVVGAAIAVFILLLPKSHHAKVTPVEYLPAARALAKQTAMPVYAPEPLPSGWQANYIRIAAAPNALHIGFVYRASDFARLDQSQHPDEKFYKDAYVPSTRASQATVTALKTPPPPGFEVRQAGGHVALVRSLPAGAVLTISDGGTSGGANLAQLVTIARSLKQQPAAG